MFAFIFPWRICLKRLQLAKLGKFIVPYPSCAMPGSPLVEAIAFSLKVSVLCPFPSCPDDPHFWIPTGRAAWLNEAHSSLPLHCMAGSWGARDHPVPDSVCQNCKRLYQQDPRHRTKYCTLQVCAAAKGQWHRAPCAYPWEDPKSSSLLDCDQPQNLRESCWS